MKRTIDTSDYSNYSNCSSPSSSPQSTGTTSQNAAPPTVSTQFNFRMDTEMPGWFSLAASSRTVKTNATASQPHLPVRNADQDGWSDNDGDDETSAPASSAGAARTTTEPDFLPNTISGENTEDNESACTTMPAGYSDGYVETDFNQKYTVLLAEAGDGDAAAQYEIAKIYASGMIDGKDLEDARKWLQRAADQGHTEARQLLEKHFS